MTGAEIPIAMAVAPELLGAGAGAAGAAGIGAGAGTAAALGTIGAGATPGALAATSGLLGAEATGAVGGLTGGLASSLFPGGAAGVGGGTAASAFGPAAGAASLSPGTIGLLGGGMAPGASAPAAAGLSGGFGGSAASSFGPTAASSLGIGSAPGVSSPTIPAMLNADFAMPSGAPSLGGSGLDDIASRWSGPLDQQGGIDTRMAENGAANFSDPMERARLFGAKTMGALKNSGPLVKGMGYASQMMKPQQAPAPAQRPPMNTGQQMSNQEILQRLKLQQMMGGRSNFAGLLGRF